METINQKFREGKRLFTHSVDSCRLNPGDHIYAYRVLGSYSHHGIYVGEDRVIHFNRTEIKDVSELKEPCAKCGYQHNVHLGVVKSCLNCFLSNGTFSGNSLCLYQYEVSRSVKKLKRSGTCSTSKCLSPETVVQKAHELHKENSFGPYDLVDNNCEHFATFCKTGIKGSEQVHSVKKTPIMPVVLDFVKKNCKGWSGS